MRGQTVFTLCFTKLLPRYYYQNNFYWCCFYFFFNCKWCKNVTKQQESPSILPSTENNASSFRTCFWKLSLALFTQHSRYTRTKLLWHLDIKVQFSSNSQTFTNHVVENLRLSAVTRFRHICIYKITDKIISPASDVRTVIFTVWKNFLLRSSVNLRKFYWKVLKRSFIFTSLIFLPSLFFASTKFISNFPLISN